MLTISAIPGFTDNYFWKLSDGGYAAVIDPGAAETVIDALEQDGETLIAILLTHHHADHVAGVRPLVAHFGCPVYGPATEHLPQCDVPLREGDNIVLAELDASLNILDLPGHTAGHIGYLHDDHLFCGDTLFAGGCGRLFEGTAAQMVDSLRKIAALDTHTQIYCAHEYTLENLRFARSVDPHNPALNTRWSEANALRQRGAYTVPSRLELELQTNPFLRTNEPALRQAAHSALGHEARDCVETFAALRALKDHF